jgi:hypothetical protein
MDFSQIGAIREGINEKDLTLDLTQRVASILKSKGYKVAMTRTEDVYLGLQERCDFTEDENPEIFVSIHVNSAVATEPFGLETHYYHEPSKELAEIIQKHLLKEINSKDRGILKSKFYVINHTDVPAVLVETGFLSNPDERAELAHTGLQARMMDKDKFKKNTMLESKPGAKRLRFKHTKFMNESQVLTRIPEQYKVDGQVIYMCDKADNEYIVECVRSERSGIIETNIVSYSNKTAMNEQMNRIQELMGFKTNTNDRYNQINENKEFGKILDTTRNKTTID